ncbi:helix-turn-helix domain-containing protein, partial [Patulibacter medicamentivorans]|uniref:helix-turn-helix domain-containing protein n=1 Tax=Patulibacter medicamentivorans TaxID=1097667 RepID=UPI001B8C1814
MSPASMLRWELSGKQPQRQEHVDRLARVLDRPADELAPGREDEVPVSTGSRSVGSGSDDARSPSHRARLDAGWTREKLAWEVGASQASLLRWEPSGKQRRRQEHVDRLARVLDRP